MKKALFLALKPHLPNGLLGWFTQRTVSYAFNKRTQELRSTNFYSLAPNARHVVHHQLLELVELCDGGWVLCYDRRDTMRNGVYPRNIVRLRSCKCNGLRQWWWLTFVCTQCAARQAAKVACLQRKKHKIISPL